MAKSPPAQRQAQRDTVNQRGYVATANRAPSHARQAMRREPQRQNSCQVSGVQPNHAAYKRLHPSKRHNRALPPPTPACSPQSPRSQSAGQGGRKADLLPRLSAPPAFRRKRPSR